MELAPISLPCEVTYEWSPKLAKMGARRFLLRQGWPAIVGLSVIVGFLGVLLALSGENYWWFLVAAAVAFPWFVWWRGVHRATRTGCVLPAGRITLRIEPDAITFQRDGHDSATKWSEIRKLWCFPDVLLLFFRTSRGCCVIPLAPLGEELKRHIARKVKEYGGEVS